MNKNIFLGFTWFLYNAIPVWAIKIVLLWLTQLQFLVFYVDTTRFAIPEHIQYICKWSLFSQLPHEMSTRTTRVAQRQCSFITTAGAAHVGQLFS